MPVQQESNQSFGAKEHRQENPLKCIVNWATKTSPYHSLSYYPTPNKKKVCNCPLYLKSIKDMVVHEANLRSIAPMINT